MKKFIYNIGTTFFALATTCSVTMLIYQLYYNIVYFNFNLNAWCVIEHWSIKLVDLSCVAFLLGSICCALIVSLKVIKYIYERMHENFVESVENRVIDRLKETRVKSAALEMIDEQ